MTARRMDLVATKTYATAENAERAVAKFTDWPNTLRYAIVWTKEGRCFPVFIGAAAINHGVHFHFHVVG